MPSVLVLDVENVGTVNVDDLPVLEYTDGYFTLDLNCSLTETDVIKACDILNKLSHNDRRTGYEHIGLNNTKLNSRCYLCSKITNHTLCH